MRVVPPDAALLLAAIVESSDDAILSLSLDGIITSWNRGAEALYGYDRSEAVGASITLIVPEDRRREQEQVLERVRLGERVEHFDTVRRDKQGRVVDVSLTVSPIRDPEGRIVGVSKIARDITGRRQMEAVLRESQRRLIALALGSASLVGSPDIDTVHAATIDLARGVFAADGYAVWRVDAAGRWRIVRSAGVSAAFVSRSVTADAEGGGATRILFEEPMVVEDATAMSLPSFMRDAYEREGIRSLIVFPLRIRKERLGTLVFYSRRPRTYSDEDLQVGGAIANLAAASLTTAELYEEQRRAREAADHARDQAAFLADAGTVLSASLDYQTTLKAVARLAVPNVADWCAVDILDESGRLQRLAVAHVDPAKLEIERQLTARYPRDRDTPGGVHDVMRTGRPALVPRITREMIDRVARDAEHRRLLDELQLTSFMCAPMMAHGKAFGALTFVSAESGREYGEGDLRLARELAARASLAVENARSYAQANEASRLKDEFLATLSHELRTPLNAVLGYARMLRTGALPPERAGQGLEAVERNAAALQQIIEDVLDVSRIVSGRLRLHVAPVDLSAILREACATVMPAADAKGVRVDVAIEPLDVPVSGDANRLRQVVWNLLSNAIKFTPGGGRVQLRLSRVDSHVEIAVTDTGRGISPEFLPLVFERFRQGDASITREQGGLGLGLAIAKQLTELHGGTIEAQSEGSGRGATFVVRLPVTVERAGTRVC